MALILIFKPRARFIITNELRQSRLGLITESLGRWEPYIKCPWDRITKLEYDKDGLGSFRIIIPFLTYFQVHKKGIFDDINRQVNPLNIPEFYFSDIILVVEKNTTFTGVNTHRYLYPQSYYNLVLESRCKSPKTSQRFMQALPTALILNIAGFVNSQLFLTTCKSLLEVFKNPSLWKNLILRDFSNFIHSSQTGQYQPAILKDIYQLLYFFNILTYKILNSLPNFTVDEDSLLIFRKINHLKSEMKCIETDYPWMQFIIGNLRYYGLKTEEKSDHGFIQDLKAAYDQFKAAGEAKEPLTLALPMFAITYSEYHTKMSHTYTLAEQKRIFLNSLIFLKSAFDQIHDPIVCFHIGLVCLELAHMTVDKEQKSYQSQIFQWYQKALDLGLKNRGQPPLSLISRKSLATRFLTQDYPRGSKAQFDFFEKNYMFGEIFTYWKLFEAKNTVGKGIAVQKNTLNQWMKQMRESKIDLKLVYAEALLEIFNHPAEYKLDNLSYLSEIEIQSYAIECSDILKLANPIQCWNSYRFVAPPNSRTIDKHEIETILKDIITRQKKLKEKPQIQWQLISVGHTPCVKMSVSFKETHKEWYINKFKDYKISFEYSQSNSCYLIIHNVNPKSFEKDPVPASAPSFGSS